MDQGKSVFCTAEISISLLKKFPAVSSSVNLELSDIDLDIEKGQAIRCGIDNAVLFSSFFGNVVYP